MKIAAIGTTFLFLLGSAQAVASQPPKPTCNVTPIKVSGLIKKKEQKQVPPSEDFEVADAAECLEEAQDQLGEPFETTYLTYSGVGLGGGGRTATKIANKVTYKYNDDVHSITGEIVAP
jgi:hypothetical protein